MIGSLTLELNKLVLVASQTNQTNTTLIENYISGIINSVVDIALVVGLMAGVAGIILYVMMGVLQMQVFTGMFAGSAGRRIWQGLEISITIPVIIAILYTLDVMASQGMFGSTGTTGTMGWTIHEIWLYISHRLGDVASTFLGK